MLTAADPIQHILIRLSVNRPHRLELRLLAPPPDWIEADFNQTVPDESENVEPVPEFEFDQTVSW